KKKGKYKGRKANQKTHELIIKLRPNHTIAETARLAGCSESLVKLVWANHQKAQNQ
ncbi:resolvase, partial [Vibrio parahaemolyticus]